MTRFRFPQDNTSFLYTGPGEPIRQPWEMQLAIFADAACTVPANITTLDGQPLLGSLIFIGKDGLIPDFLGPDGALMVYAKPPDDPAYPLVAKLDQYIDAKVLALAGVAPDMLDTLGELAAALNDDPHAFDTLAAMATQPLVFTKNGTLTAPYASPYLVYNDTAYAWVVKTIRASVGTAPDGAAVTLSVRRSDTHDVVGTVVIPSGETMAVLTLPTPFPSVPSGVGLYITVETVGMATAGADLSVQVTVTNQIVPSGS